MDATVKGTLDTLVGAFSQYNISNANLRSEVNEFCKKITRFAEENDDPASFFALYAESGIPEEYSALITRVAMASTRAANEDGSAKMDYSDTPDKTEADLPSVKEFVDQYRAAYDEVCKGDNPRSKAAYECIFDVANRTDDLIEAQIILERERLLWNIVKDGALDSLVPTLQKMDPLNMAATAKLIDQIHIYNHVTSDEEFTYKIDLQEVNDVAIIADYTSKMHLVICIATDLIKYLNAKEVVYAWKTDFLVQGAIKAMLKNARHLRQILEYMKQYLNMTFDYVLADESLKIWLLKPRNIDEFGREKQVLNPKYYEIFKDIIENEILPDVDIVQNLLS